MARRTAALIQAEINTLETFLASADSLLSSVSADGTSRTVNRMEAAKRLDQLYIQLERRNGNEPMFVRGVIKGM